MTAAAVDLLRPLDGKNQGTLGAIKQTMFAPAVPCVYRGEPWVTFSMSRPCCQEGSNDRDH